MQRLRNTAIWAAVPSHTSRAVSVLRNLRCQKKPSVFACLSKLARKINSAAWWSSPRACPSKTLPAICDIWLGKRTVPVYAVAKEVSALQRWPRSRSGRAEDRSTTKCGEKFLSGHLSVVCLDVFSPSRSNNRLGLLSEYSKLTCFAKERATWFLGGEID